MLVERSERSERSVCYGCGCAVELVLVVSVGIACDRAARAGVQLSVGESLLRSVTCGSFAQSPRCCAHAAVSICGLGSASDPELLGAARTSAIAQ